MFRQYGVKVGIAALLFGLVQYIMNYPMAFIAAALVFLLPYFLQESRALFGDVIRYKQTTEFTASLSSLIRTYGTLEGAMEHVKPEKFPAISHIVRQIRQGMAAGRPASSVFMNEGYKHDNRYLVEIGKLFLILEEQNAQRDYIIERLESLRIAFQNENIDREQGAKVKKRMLKSSLLLNGFVVFVVVTVMPGLIHEPFKFYFRTGLGQVLSTVGVITLLLPHTYVFFLNESEGKNLISFFEQRLERDFARFQIKIKPRTFIVLMACICIPPPVIILNWVPSLWYLAILCFLSPLSYLSLQSFYGLRKEEGITNEVRRWYRRYQFARGSNARPEQAIEMAIWDMQYLKKPFQLILHRWGNGIPMEAAFAETHMDELPMIQTLINMLEVSLTSTDLKVIREQEELLEREMKIQMEDKQRKDQQRLDLIGYTAIITTFALIVLPVIFDSITKMDMIG